MSVKEDILIINPGGRKKVYQELSDKFTAVEPPIWAGLITTFLQKKNIKAKLIDSNALNLSPMDIAKEYHQQSELIAIIAYGHNPSASTQTMPAVTEQIAALRDKDYQGKIVLVGGHVAALPKRTLQDEDVDFVCTGEGPYTLLDLVQAHYGKKDYQSARGLCFRYRGEIIQTPPAPLVLNLDEEMPGLPWDQLPISTYRAHNWHGFGENSRSPYISLYTTLGCPYHCTFCCIQAPFKEGEKLQGFSQKRNSYRKWSPKNIVDQIEYLNRVHNVKNIKFADELFVLDNEHVSSICKLLIEKKLELNIWAYSRVDTINEELVSMFKKAGIKWICLGIESFDDESKQSVKKKISREKIFSTVKLLKDHDINIIGNFIFGLPNDTNESMKRTLEDAKLLELDFANFYCTMAYPGSDLYRDAINRSLDLPDNWEGFSQHSYNSLPLPTQTLSGIDVLKFRDQAFHDFYEDQDYLNYIKSKFGRAAYDNVKLMTKTRLKRAYHEQS